MLKTVALTGLVLCTRALLVLPELTEYGEASGCEALESAAEESLMLRANASALIGRPLLLRRAGLVLPLMLSSAAVESLILRARALIGRPLFLFAAL